MLRFSVADQSRSLAAVLVLGVSVSVSCSGVANNATLSESIGIEAEWVDPAANAQAEFVYDESDISGGFPAPDGFSNDPSFDSTVCEINEKYFRYRFEAINRQLADNADLATVFGDTAVTDCEGAHRFIQVKRFYNREHSGPVLVARGDLVEEVVSSSSAVEIYGGVADTAPYVVRITVNTGCTGVRISKNWILTAAHCVDDLPAYPGVARRAIFASNGTCLTSSCGTGDYALHYVHQDYSGDNDWDDDVALIHFFYGLSGNPTTSQRGRVANYMSGDGATVRLFGQGHNQLCGGGAGTVRSADFTVYDVHSEYTEFSNSNTKRFCKGDSGGPLARNWGPFVAGDGYVVEGVLSGSSGYVQCGAEVCGIEPGQGMTTNLSKKISWISGIAGCTKTTIFYPLAYYLCG